MSRQVIINARVAALFVTALQPSHHPEPAVVRQELAAAVRRWGTRGCWAGMAAEFGERPHTAVVRRQWACGVIREIFPDRAGSDDLGRPA